VSGILSSHILFAGIHHCHRLSSHSPSSFSLCGSVSPTLFVPYLYVCLFCTTPPPSPLPEDCGLEHPLVEGFVFLSCLCLYVVSFCDVLYRAIFSCVVLCLFSCLFLSLSLSFFLFTLIFMLSHVVVAAVILVLV
jgi:hypothetical protein